MGTHRQLLPALLQKDHFPKEIILHQTHVSATRPVSEKVPDQGPEQVMGEQSNCANLWIRSGFYAQTLSCHLSG